MEIAISGLKPVRVGIPLRRDGGTDQHAIYDALPQNAGKAESDAIPNGTKIAFAYDVPNRKFQVAYVNNVTESTTNYHALNAIPCKYISQDFFVSSGR